LNQLTDLSQVSRIKDFVIPVMLLLLQLIYHLL